MPPADELLELLDTLPASVALWDRDVRLRYGNRRALTRFGLPVEQLVGVPLSDVVQAHAVELSAQYIDGALAGHVQQVERAMIDSDGQRYNAHQVTHVPDVVDSTVIGYCALAVDITSSIEGYERARHAREHAALRAERARIAGNLDEHNVISDLEAAIGRLDRAVERASDAVPDLDSAAEAIDRTIAELRASVPARLRGPDPAQVEFPSMPAVGPRMAAVPDAGVPWPPELTGRGWTAEQVTALLDLVPAAVALWDAEQRNVFANRAALRWYGRRSRADAQGRHVRELLGDEDYTATVLHVQGALAGQPQQFDRSVPRRDGLRHMQSSLTPHVRDGAVVGFSSFVVDVTARMESELALQDARARLASSRERERIADELHNMVIQRLFATGLTANRASSAASAAELRQVQDGIEAALRDLESALTALRENVGLVDLLPDLAHVVYDATKPHHITAAIENVGSVEYVPPEVGAELLAVAEQGLSNVAEHAQASAVVVTIAASSAGVWLRVVDDGVGLGSARPGAGMTDMLARATRLGGTCTWRAAVPAGTLVDWRVPPA